MMIKLIINTEEINSDTTSFGGLPVKNKDEDFDWPKCSECNSPMQFLGKIETDIGIEQIFMCQNDPGCCDEWEADGGGNKVVIVRPINLEQVAPPSEGETQRDCVHGAKLINFDSNDYDEARTDWAGKTDESPRNVLGQLGGAPSWLQNDETPNCDGCGKVMNFVAQLEQGPNWETEMNFGGGGCAYLFDCNCNNSAKFLWQC